MSRKLTHTQKAAAKLAAEERSAIEFQRGWDVGLSGQTRTEDGQSGVYYAGRVAGYKEYVRRLKELDKADSEEVE